MCNLIELNPNPYCHLDYAELNMHYTNMMWDRADRISQYIIYAIPTAAVATAEVVKNASFLLYNAAVCVINTTSSLLYKISTIFANIFQSIIETPTNTQLNTATFRHQTATASPERRITSHFESKDLASFKLAMRTAASADNNPISEHSPIEAYVQNQRCTIWYNLDQDAVNVRITHQGEQRTLTMKIDDLGNISSLTVNGAQQTTFPDIFELYMWACFQQSFEASSEYRQEENHIKIRVVREGLNQAPDFHLNSLAEQLGQLNNGKTLNVKFLNFDLQQGEGIDAGGLSRDFMDDLWHGLLSGNSRHLTFSKRPNETEAMPQVTGQPNADGIPRALPHQEPLLRNMGATMMHCFLTDQQIPIGRRFEEGLFKAIFSLTEAEVQADHLPFAVQLKMMKAISEFRDSQNLVTAIRALEENNWDAIRDNAEWIGAEVPDTDEFNAGNQNHQNIVTNALKGYLYEQYSSTLVPIHQIAKGMKLIANNLRHPWGAIAWQDFSDQVQGSLDRQFIADNIEINNNVAQAVRRKAQWLREWILDEETPNSQIQEFIKFATGSTTLPVNGRIRVTEQDSDYLPVPKAHSCFSSIEISPVDASYGRHNDYTKEAFIESLVSLANFEYQMG